MLIFYVKSTIAYCLIFNCSVQYLMQTSEVGKISQKVKVIPYFTLSKEK